MSFCKNHTDKTLLDENHSRRSSSLRRPAKLLKLANLSQFINCKSCFDCPFHDTQSSPNESIQSLSQLLRSNVTEIINTSLDESKENLGDYVMSGIQDHLMCRMDNFALSNFFNPDNVRSEKRHIQDVPQGTKRVKQGDPPLSVTDDNLNMTIHEVIEVEGLVISDTADVIQINRSKYKPITDSPSLDGLVKVDSILGGDSPPDKGINSVFESDEDKDSPCDISKLTSKSPCDQVKEIGGYNMALPLKPKRPCNNSSNACSLGQLDDLIMTSLAKSMSDYRSVEKGKANGNCSAATTSTTATSQQAIASLSPSSAVLSTVVKSLDNEAVNKFLMDMVKQMGRDDALDLNLNMTSGFESNNMETETEDMESASKNVETAAETSDTSTDNVATSAESVDTAAESIDTSAENVETSPDNEATGMNDDKELNTTELQSTSKHADELMHPPSGAHQSLDVSSIKFKPSTSTVQYDISVNESVLKSSIRTGESCAGLPAPTSAESISASSNDDLEQESKVVNRKARSVSQINVPLTAGSVSPETSDLEDLVNSSNLSHEDRWRLCSSYLRSLNISSHLEDITDHVTSVTESADSVDESKRKSKPLPTRKKGSPRTKTKTSSIEVVSSKRLPTLDEVLEKAREDRQRLKEHAMEICDASVHDTEIERNTYVDDIAELRDRHVIDEASAEVSPLFRVIDVRKTFKYFSVESAEVLWNRTVMPSLEKKHRKMSYGQFVSLLEDGTVSDFDEKHLSRNSIQSLTSFMWKLMSIHPDAMLVSQCSTTILNWLSKFQYKCYPTVQEVLDILINAGVSRKGCQMEKMYKKCESNLRSVYKPDTSKTRNSLSPAEIKEREDVVLRNIKYIMDSLASAIVIIENWDQQSVPLSQIALISAWLSCDEQLFQSIAVLSLIDCLNNALTYISTAQWPDRMRYLTRELVCLGDGFYVRVLHLAELLVQSPRGSELRKKLCFCAAQHLLSEEDEHIHISAGALSVDEVLHFLRSQQQNAFKSYRLLYEFLTLIEKAVGLIFSPSDQETVQGLVSYFSAVYSKLKQDFYIGERPVLKNLLVRIRSQLHFMADDTMPKTCFFRNHRPDQA